MIIDKVESIGKSRFKVFIDGVFAFVLYKGELSRFGISAGAKISDEEYNRICNEVILKRAKLRAMHLLEQLDRTEENLRIKLRLGFYPEDIIDQAIGYVKSFGYIDDSSYARRFIESRKGKKSRRELYALLSARGIAVETINQALDCCYDSKGEEDAIRQLIHKKKINIADATASDMNKLYNYLFRKGFHYDIIRHVTQNYHENA